MDAVPGNYRTIAGLVSGAQYEYVIAGVSQKEARAKALAEVGASLEPPMMGAELEYWMGECFRKVYSPPPPQGKAVKKAKVNRARIFDKYKAWCEAHQFVTNDTELAFWTGRHATTFGQARRMLEAMGYRFERLKHKRGWKVVGLPGPQDKTYSEAEVKTMLDAMAEEMKTKFMDEIQKGRK